MTDARPKVAIVDHSLGNLFSVRQACAHAGIDASITADPNEIGAADALILPGVGAFGDAMRTLHDRGLIAPIKTFAASGKPTIGVCLGFQLFMETSHEFGEHKGLGLIPGTVDRLFGGGRQEQAHTRNPRVPQVGWNKIRRSRGSSHGRRDPWIGTPLRGLGDETYVYFVHSYYVLPRSEADSVATTIYEGLTYCSAAKKDNIFGCQFHPERSGQLGLRVYQNIAESLRDG